MHRERQVVFWSLVADEKAPRSEDHVERTDREGVLAQAVPRAGASAGSDFLAEVCVAWEREAERAESHGVRVVRVRIGLVMSKDGGALEQMLPLFKLGLGGTMGPGDQWWPWIHLDDLIGVIRYAIDHDDVRGPINATAPEPVRQREFANTLAKVLHRRRSCLPRRSRCAARSASSPTSSSRAAAWSPTR